MVICGRTDDPYPLQLVTFPWGRATHCPTGLCVPSVGISFIGEVAYLLMRVGRVNGPLGDYTRVLASSPSFASGDLQSGTVPGRRRTSSLGSHDLSCTKASLNY
ncbi:hypothetical protein WMY93_030414 [Mugilogobius chulae]|uniref:Uncharacterized protein n=1 Tax=Mugilogobius chulae TaxID=88201 RepID=A0AAW0MJR5_9GOBI